MHRYIWFGDLQLLSDQQGEWECQLLILGDAELCSYTITKQMTIIESSYKLVILLKINFIKKLFAQLQSK